MIDNQNIYLNIRQVILAAKQKIALSANFAMVEAYWFIGKYIIEEEQHGKYRAEYGKEQMKILSEKLIKEFGGGYDRSNLLRMKKFYLLFPIRDALRHELTWTHYRSLLRVENENARGFYITETISNNWNTRVLERKMLYLPNEEELRAELEREKLLIENARK